MSRSLPLLNSAYPQFADTCGSMRFPLEAMSNGNRKLPPPFRHFLWFALGVGVGWLTHALLAA